MGSSVPYRAARSSPVGCSGAGRVEGASQAGGAGRSVEGDESDPGRGECGGGLCGPAKQPSWGVCSGGLAEHDKYLASQEVSSGGQVGQEGGVAAGRALKGRVWQGGRGVEQGVDARGEVDRLGPHEDLGCPVESVEPAGEGGHERFLLGRGAQAEGDRAGPADDGEPVWTEIDDPLGADPGEG